MGGGQLYKVGYIIQARMKSDRLPHKVLMKLPLSSDKSILDWIIDEVSTLNGTVIVATSTDESNNQIQDYCESKDVKIFRGSEDDVLSRFVAIQKEYNFDYIIRLTADNPFIDANTINDTIKFHIKQKLDYTHSTGLPLGMNIEVISGDAIIKSLNYVTNNLEKEHVTVVVRENKKFKSGVMHFDNCFENLRLTVDTMEDYLLSNSIAMFSQQRKIKGIELISKLYNSYPFIFNVNKDAYQKKVFSSIQEELESAVAFLKKNDFYNVAEILRVYMDNNINRENHK